MGGIDKQANACIGERVLNKVPVQTILVGSNY